MARSTSGWCTPRSRICCSTMSWRGPAQGSLDCAGVPWLVCNWFLCGGGVGRNELGRCAATAAVAAAASPIASAVGPKPCTARARGVGRRHCDRVVRVDDEVGALAHLERPRLVVEEERPGGVAGEASESFLAREPLVGQPADRKSV